ncbi:hypothetical protein AAV94_11895 [Lampropedia cohaerens]|uniref:MOSC domain-containing protein n=1 Tax=Lampropedia cohaerens TaxID=1610491 RepID=A0A0U1PXJ6_9BURK|nr:MOSC N-terminal beta barrel domain-containing protein [Lampropedia cohaerens]KKW67211.1 hypothetical protein AAV94_11895 [Lampropedia cohaerens]
MHVTALHRYPVKSMRGLAVDHAAVRLEGFAHDRQWLITDTEGHFITARTAPQLLRWQANADNGRLHLKAPDGASRQVHVADYTTAMTVTVWRDTFQACAGPAATDAWLSNQLGMACRLVYLGTAPTRRLAVNGQALSFADGAPYLLTTQASLHALNQQLQQQGLPPVGMARFRPNIVIDGLQAYAEDDWQTLRIGNLIFTNFKPCARCKIVNLDPDTAMLSPDKEPLRTLARTHALPLGACFGVNLYAHAAGEIRVGDPVQLLD